MPTIGRNVTRTILNATETTQQTREPNGLPLSFVLVAADSFYVGHHEKFSTRHFQMATVNTNATTVTVDAWDGDSWEPVEDLQDWTNGFKENGFVSWENISNWKRQALAPINDKELYYVRVKVSAALSAGTALSSVLNLFCDEKLLRRYYPELITDTRFLPTGRTDFVEQLEAAKDLIVLRLLQDKLIRDESQIIDINPVAIASAHAAAWIILNPIAVDEDGNTEAASRAEINYNRELNKVSLPIDFNKSGTIEETEKNVRVDFIARG